MDIYSNLYIKNYVNKKDIGPKQEKIPKIIHQIWLGGGVPDRYVFYMNTLKQANPDWEHRLWTDADVDGFVLKNKKVFSKTKSLASKSDIFRYEILERFGGIYLDTDFYGVKSFNELLYLDFFCGYHDGGVKGRGAAGGFCNGLIGTIPNGKIISALVDTLLKTKRFNYGSRHVMTMAGPHYMERELYRVLNEDDNVVVFPPEFFYPFPNTMRHIPRDSNYNEIVNSYNTENTICVHMWHTNWK